MGDVARINTHLLGRHTLGTMFRVEVTIGRAGTMKKMGVGVNQNNTIGAKLLYLARSYFYRLHYYKYNFCNHIIRNIS